jgi:exodeoxyribonuclease-3
MKIVTWNCNGALRKKTKHIDALKADVLVIQECEDPNRSTKAYRHWSGDYLWVGENKNKGIGIFVRNGNYIEKLYWTGTYNLKGFRSNNSALTWNSDDLQSWHKGERWG